MDVEPNSQDGQDILAQYAAEVQKLKAVHTKVWKELDELITFLEEPKKRLEEEIIAYEKRALEWGNHWKESFPASVPTMSVYIHFLVDHNGQYLREHGQLVFFSQQPCEASNKAWKKWYKFFTNHHPELWMRTLLIKEMVCTNGTYAPLKSVLFPHVPRSIVAQADAAISGGSLMSITGLVQNQVVTYDLSDAKVPLPKPRRRKTSTLLSPTKARPQHYKKHSLPICGLMPWHKRVMTMTVKQLRQVRQRFVLPGDMD